LFLKDVARVLYAPHKVFKEVVQNPSYLGPVLVLLLFVAFESGYTFSVLAKSNLEQTLPAGDKGDIWTGSTTYWSANTGVVVNSNYSNFINGTTGTTYGNGSIQFEATNASRIDAKIDSFGQNVNCGPNGYQNLSIRINFVTPDAKPENVSLYLTSLSSSRFYYDLTAAVSNITINEWNNLTIPVGRGNWVSSDSNADWANVTGLELDFTYSNNSHITILADGLFFRGLYKPALEIDAVSYLANGILSSFTQYVLEWLVLTALIWGLVKVFKGTVTWKPIFVCVGLALMVMVVQALITAIVAQATIPTLYYPMEYFAGIPNEYAVASQGLQNAINTFYQISIYVQLAVYVWLFTVSVFIVRAVTTFTYGKSMTIAAASLLLTIVIGLLVGF
jgi:Yip1 domain